MDQLATNTPLQPGAEESYSAEEPRLTSTPSRLSLRAKGILAFASLVIYMIVVAVIISDGRHKLFLMVEELERLHRHEEMLVQANISLARAILTVNDNYFAVDPGVTVQPIMVEVETVQSNLLGLRVTFPEVARNLAAIQAAATHLRDTPSRGDIALLRSTMHDLVTVLDGITRQEREKKQRLLVAYRVDYDAVTVETVVLSLLGVVVLGGMTALFFSRLAWDLGKLEERAMDIVMGYRGTPLEVTRGDEVGGLMEALNKMQRELREREKQLELSRQQHFHKEKMAAVGSLAAALAHEINNPIAAIAGVAESLSEIRQAHDCPFNDIPGASCQPELIIDQARRVATITRQIAEFTAPHSPEPQLLDVNALVRSTCNFIGYDRRFRNIDLDSDLDTQLPAVHAVGDHITQVLMNLLINAADAMDGIAERKARIIVTTRQSGDRVLLRVADNGAGMSEQTRARAFEEFFTTKPVGKGSGLGLALCRSLIEGCGGSISIDSQQGVGTTVTVALPTDTPAA